MRWLVLDHHFAHDIAALRRAAGEEIELDVMPYELLRCEALRVLPAEVANGVEAFTRRDLDGARRRYAAILREILEDRFTSSPFDAIVMPSDTFFYVRATPPVAHALGVPFLVVQKETTISEHTMREHSRELARHYPPLADRMTVCSERHKRFWVRAGGDPERIVVTGQPRFDFYRRPAEWPAALPIAGEGPSVLFLSYSPDAYHPDANDGSWSALHQRTEQALHELARRGWRVLVKPHPQQPIETVKAWRRRAGELWNRNVFVLDAQADVRPLIVAADVTVGFQSTALLEAMLAGRPVVYTGWDESAAAFAGELIPFHEWDDVIEVVRSAEALPQAIAAARGRACSAAELNRRCEVAERYLGPLDGHAAERAVAVLHAETELWAARRGPEQERLRERLANRRPPLRPGRRGRAFSRDARRRLGALLGRAPATYGARSPWPLSGERSPGRAA